MRDTKWNRSTKVTAAVALVGLVAVSAAILGTPQGREALPGPTADQVELAETKAALDDVREQRDAAVDRLSQPRPSTPDPAVAAQVKDLRAQNKSLSARLAAPRGGSDNGGSGSTGRPSGSRLGPPAPRPAGSGGGAAAGGGGGRAPTGDASKARADDLKAQRDALEVERDDAERRAALLGPEQAARADLKAQVDALSAPRPPAEPEPEVPVVASLTRQQIIDSRQQFGLYTQQSPFNYAEFSNIEAQLGRDAQTSGYFQDWTTPFRPDAVQAAWSRGQVPLLTWESQAQVGRVGPNQADYSLGSIIGGVHDDYITEYARSIAATGLPVVIRFDHEMNGDWYPWSETGGRDDRSVNGNERGQYPEMWRHVHDLFQAQGANDYVVWLWAPNRVDRVAGTRTLTDYYPGDEYVDMVGMSAYARPGYVDTSFPGVFAATVQALSFADKPVVIAETGVAGDRETKVRFVNDFFAGLPTVPNLSGFVWFNITASTATGTNDWRLDADREVRQAFADGLDSSGYGRERKTP